MKSEATTSRMHIYEKEDAIRALKNLEMYFDGDSIELQHFKFQAEIIENTIDYLIARLAESESKRF